MDTPIEQLEAIKASLGTLPERLANALQAMPRPASIARPNPLETSEGRAKIASDRMGQPLGMQDWKLLGASVRGLFGGDAKQEGGEDKKPAQLPPREQLSSGPSASSPLTQMPMLPPVQRKTMLAGPMEESGKRFAHPTMLGPSAEGIPEDRAQTELAPHGPAGALASSAGGAGFGGSDITQVLKDLTDALRDLTEEMQKDQENTGAQPHGMPKTPGQTVFQASRSFAGADAKQAQTGSTRPRVTTSVVDSQRFTQLRSG